MVRSNNIKEIRQFFNQHTEEEKKMIVNIQDAVDQTPLHYAALKNNAEAIDRLAKHRADVNAKDNKNRTPLGYAVLDHKVEATDRLIEHGADVKVKDNYGLTPLHFAALNNSAEAIDRLVEHRADVNAKDSDGLTPLHFAALNNVEAIDRLVKHGANVNAKDNGGITPLHYVAMKDQAELIEMFLKKGMGINTQNKDCEKLMNYAVFKNSFSKHKEINFLAKKEFLNTQDNNGKTPLHYATENGNVETVKILLKEGAVINLQDNDGRTLMDIATQYNNQETIDLLKANMSNFMPLTSLTKAITEGTSAPNSPESDFNIL